MIAARERFLADGVVGQCLRAEAQGLERSEGSMWRPRAGFSPATRFGDRKPQHYFFLHLQRPDWGVGKAHCDSWRGARSEFFLESFPMQRGPLLARSLLEK